MKDIKFDDLLEKIPNKYILTLTAGKRAREILAGDKQLVETPEKTTIVRKVFLEIMHDKIGFENE